MYREAGFGDEMELLEKAADHILGSVNLSFDKES